MSAVAPKSASADFPVMALLSDEDLLSAQVVEDLAQAVVLCSQSRFAVGHKVLAHV